MDDILKAIGCLLAAYWAYSFFKGLQAVNHAPGYRPMFSPMTLVGAILPMTWWNLGLDWPWKYRKTAYFDQKHDIISIVPWFHGTPLYYISSLRVSRQLLTNEGRMMKPEEMNSSLLIWGNNIFSANHDEWKKHRKIMNPAFSTKTYSMVVSQTKNIYKDMIESEGWDKKSDVAVESVTKFTLRTAFLVIARCGFGMNLHWAAEDNEVGDADAARALTTVLGTTILRLLLPSWMYRLPIERLKTIDQAWHLFSKFMKKSVQNRSEELAGNPELLNTSADVFTLLVSTLDGEEKNKLEPDEVIGNTFTLMFAGHETTGLVLATTLAYFSISPDDQTKAYEEIISVISHRDPTLEDLSKLKHTLACFQEAMRLYPSGNILVRKTIEDIPVEVSNPSQSTMILPKGSTLIFDMIGMHRNPHVFPEPDVFKPSRWYGVVDADVTMFGVGSRACIGRKFTQTESLTFLSLFLRDWKIEPILQDGESLAQYEQRVMSHAGRIGLTFGITNPIRLKLTRRT